MMTCFKLVFPFNNNNATLATRTYDGQKYREVAREQKKFLLADGTEYLADDCIDGFLINPRLLPDPMPQSPFILHADSEYSVHYLSGGHFRCSSVFDTLEEALNHAGLKN